MLTHSPRWLLLAALIFAPWAFGSTRPWTIDLLNILLGVVLVLWLIQSITRRSRISLPLPLLISTGYLVLHGWAMTLNAGFLYDQETRTFIARTPLFPMLPGSIDQIRSLEIALRTTLLLGVTCYVCQLAPNPIWRRRLVLTMGLAGASLAAFGLIQRLLNAPSIFWLPGNTGETFFASFRYHSNAGAFINLVWPLLIALLAGSLRRPLRDSRHPADPGPGRPTTTLPTRLGWAVALLACFTGLIISGARAATAIALPFIGCWAVWWIHQTRQHNLPRINPANAAVAGALGLLLLASLAATAGLDLTLHRWNKTAEIFSLQNPRLLVDGVCLNQMLPNSGWFGFGPGTFRHAFPHFTNHLGDTISGVWLDAHQDCLQTAIEWGYLGAAAWALCVLGALFHSFHKRTGPETETPQRAGFTDRTLHFALLISAGTILLHAQVDFPLQIASLQLYFAVILGLLWSRPSWRSSPYPAPVPA